MNNMTSELIERLKIYSESIMLSEHFQKVLSDAAETLRDLSATVEIQGKMDKSIHYYNNSMRLIDANKLKKILIQSLGIMV